jgi:hypothetical protein
VAQREPFEDTLSVPVENGEALLEKLKDAVLEGFAELEADVLPLSVWSTESVLLAHALTVSEADAVPDRLGLAVPLSVALGLLEDEGERELSDDADVVRVARDVCVGNFVLACVGGLLKVSVTCDDCDGVARPLAVPEMVEVGEDERKAESVAVFREEREGEEDPDGHAEDEREVQEEVDTEGV